MFSDFFSFVPSSSSSSSFLIVIVIIIIIILSGNFACSTGKYANSIFWTLTIKTPFLGNREFGSHDAVTQANGYMTWTFTINAATLTEAQDVAVVQATGGGATGTLTTALTGTSITTITVTSAIGQTFDTSVNLVVGSTTIKAADVTAVSSSTMPNAVGTLRTVLRGNRVEDVLIECASGVKFDASNDLVLGNLPMILVVDVTASIHGAHIINTNLFTHQVYKFFCKNCGDGTSTDGPGALQDSECSVMCPKGTFSSDNGCSKCLAGRYQDDTKRTLCKPCSAGRYSTETGLESNDQCSLCPQSWYSQLEDEESSNLGCTKCPNGKHNLNPGGLKLDCINCQSIDVAVGCTKCPEGTSAKILTNEKIECSVCQEGMYQPFISEVGEVLVCKFCGAGKRFVNIYTACEDCDMGKYQAENNVAGCKCKFCPAGTSYATSSTTCQTCAAGMYQNQNKASSVGCKNCTEKGEYSTPGSSKCLICGKGKYQDETTPQPQCKLCALGRFNINSNEFKENHDDEDDCVRFFFLVQSFCFCFCFCFFGIADHFFSFSLFLFS